MCSKGNLEDFYERSKPSSWWGWLWWRYISVHQGRTSNQNKDHLGSRCIAALHLCDFFFGTANPLPEGHPSCFAQRWNVLRRRSVLLWKGRRLWLFEGLLKPDHQHEKKGGPSSQVIIFKTCWWCLGSCNETFKSKNSGTSVLTCLIGRQKWGRNVSISWPRIIDSSETLLFTGESWFGGAFAKITFCTLLRSFPQQKSILTKLQHWTNSRQKLCENTCFWSVDECQREEWFDGRKMICFLLKWSLFRGSC